ncbi:MAG: AAA family ATPase, partial [Candidatus Solibacter usitatus]|nr:AAA family ATPase [Candidatus Solibacter usitatus]
SAQVSGREQEHARLQTTAYETEARLTEARRQLAELETEQAVHRRQVDEWERQAAEARDRSLRKNEQREALQNRLRERERALESSRMTVLRLLGEASTLKNQLAQIDEYLAGVDRETARAQREEQTAVSDLARLETEKEKISGVLARQQLELESLQDRRRRAEEELGLRKRAAAQARQAIDELRAETGRLQARKDSLEEILSHRAYTTESVKRLFGAIQQGQAQDFRPLGVLADFVEVDPAYEKAAEEFLHDELEYVVVPDWENAERGIDLMRRDLEGRATFLVHPDGGGDRGPGSKRANGEPAIGPETGIVARLSDCLRLINGLRDRAQDLLPRLAGCFIAEDRAAAQRLSAQYPHLYFLLADGVCYHGYALSGGKKRGSGPLALKRELRELTGAVQTRQRELDARTLQLQALDRDIARIEEELESLRQEQQSSEKTALALDHEIRKLSEELSRTGSRLSLSRLDLDRLAQEKQRSVEQRARNLQAVADKEQARLAEEESLETARQSLEDLDSELAAVLEEHAAIRVELAGLEERCRSERAAISRLESQWKERTARRLELAKESERLSVERARLLADNIDLDRKAAVLAGQVQETGQRVDLLAASELETRTALAAGEEELKALRAWADGSRERRAQIEVGLVKIEAELKYLDETSHRELNRPVRELRLEGDAELDADGVAEAERLCQEIKARIEAMGPVNPQALEEYQETQQRYDFLNAQRQDLLDSIRDTEKAIQEIDTVSRQRFAEAFEAINNNFRQTFQTLFGGGVGEMRLTDETNLADSGIEMVASPPGKKLQNVLLLSGGEKALTALALLMAIFRFQPSPFCILDEVDAPLDEPNIERLMRLLKEMSLETQFILITHSRKTMESAQAMYGVTMQEPGISKLVSVKFDGMAPQPATQPRREARAAG